MDNQWYFELWVEGISRERCDEILQIVTAMVAASGGQVGGGFAPVSEDIEFPEECTDETAS